jgi:hypothetical protein
MGMERHYAHAAGSNFLESLGKAMKSSIRPLVPYLWLPVCDLPPGGSASAEADATRLRSIAQLTRSLFYWFTRRNSPGRFPTTDNICDAVLNVKDEGIMAEITSLNDFFIFHPMYHRVLAELMGVSTSAVDKWSNGDRRVSQRTLNELNRLHIFLNTNPELRKKYVKVAQCAV